MLVPLDLSASAERVVGRVSLMPLAEGARVVLLHVVPKSLPQSARRRAESDARVALADVAAELERALPTEVAVRTAVAVGVPAAEIARRAPAAKAELIVMGRGGDRGLRDLFIGSTAERVVRRSRLPVLVVRRPPQGPYRRPVLALDEDAAALPALSFATRLIPPSRSPIPLVHAYDAPFEGLIYPSLTPAQARAFRRRYREQAIRRMKRLIRKAQRTGMVPTELRWAIRVQPGSPRIVVARSVAKMRADLLVLGTHARSGVAHAFLGTVAGDVLRTVASDVLVVPPRRARATS